MDQHPRREHVLHPSVGQILEGWASERPDLDPWSVGLWALIKQIDSHLEVALAPTFAKHGVNGRDFELLSAVRRTGAPYTATPTELAARLVVPAATMTKRLDRLQNFGLLERQANPQDRRAINIRLTTRGMELTDALIEEVDAETRQLMADVADQRDDLITQLSHLLSGVLPEPSVEGRRPSVD